MNFIFISPNFPHTHWQFCDRLRKSGVNVLGIGDAPYFNLEERLRDTLTEYYFVQSLKDYDQVYRAVAFFAFKYGKIDWLESNNEYWLEQDARLRTDFHITTGAGVDEIAAWKQEASVQAALKAAGIPCAAEGNGGGDVYSYDAIADSHGAPLFEAMTVWPAVSGGEDAPGFVHYVSAEMPETLRTPGRKALEALNVRSRFVHLEFAKTADGGFAALRARMRPADGYTPDMLNYAHSTDVYKIWADMVTQDKRTLPDSGDHHCCVFASRRDWQNFSHTHEDILARYGRRIALCGRVPEQLQAAMGGQMYITHADTEAEAREFALFVHERG